MEGKRGLLTVTVCQGLLHCSVFKRLRTGEFVITAAHRRIRDHDHDHVIKSRDRDLITGDRYLTTGDRDLIIRDRDLIDT